MPDGFRVYAIAASKPRCRWVQDPGTVSPVVSACFMGKTDSIHLAPQRVNDYTNCLVAGDCVVGVADIKLDCHSHLAFVAREVPTVEGNVRGFHGWCSVDVGFVVGFAGLLMFRLFWHDYRSLRERLCLYTRPRYENGDENAPAGRFDTSQGFYHGRRIEEGLSGSHRTSEEIWHNETVKS